MRFLIVLLLGMAIARAAEYYVAPAATFPASLGSLANPWPLQFALTNSALKPGDTVWLRGGTYFPPARISALAGTNILGNGFGWTVAGAVQGAANNLITFRGYPGEFPKIDRPWSMGGSGYLRFRDLEFYDSLKGFIPGIVGFPKHFRWVHFEAGGTIGNYEWINCVVHDVNNAWAGLAAGRSIRGCIIWHAGNSESDHVTYNCPDEFLGNISAWHTADALNLTPRPYTCRSNILFGAGQTIGGAASGDFRLNGTSVIAFNYVYNRYPNNIIANSLLMNGGSYTITNNIFVTSTGCIVSGGLTAATLLNNIFCINNSFANYPVILRTSANGAWSVNNNKYFNQTVGRSVRIETTNVSLTFPQWQATFPGFDTTSASTDGGNPPDSIHVIPNQDESRRAHIAIYNFTRKDVVAVSLAGILNTGDRYYLHSAQNYGTPIQIGIYNGVSITVPMTNLAVAIPIFYNNPPEITTGLANYYKQLLTPPPTSPEFAAFVVKGAPPIQPPPNFRTVSP